MTLALTKFKAYGVRTSGAVRQQTMQVAEMYVTGAATDTAWDIASDTSGALGTFWTAVTADSTYGTLATNALTSIRSIVAVADDLKIMESEALSNYEQIAGGGLMSFLSAASVGGAAAEAYTVTGLLSTDTILSVVPKIASATGRNTLATISATVAGGAATGNATATGLLGTDTVLAVSQSTKGANSLPLLGYGAPATDAIPFVYSADPGASGVLRVLYSRAATTDTYVPVSYGAAGTNSLTVTYGANPGAGAKVVVTVWRGTGTVTPLSGQFVYSTSGHLPSMTFATANAPTTAFIKLWWTLQDNIEAVNADSGASF